jgi:hypothetical protein
VKYELGFCIPGDGILHSNCRENLKCYIYVIYLLKSRSIKPANTRCYTTTDEQATNRCYSPAQDVFCVIRVSHNKVCWEAAFSDGSYPRLKSKGQATVQFTERVARQRAGEHGTAGHCWGHEHTRPVWCSEGTIALVGTSRTRSMNPITRPHPIYSHSHTCCDSHTGCHIPGLVWNPKVY